ncbi:hypothetical protein EUGRSUZ_G00707 [Eucalyptus grandis]|uniref:Uncharacterized protein n=2 Tax=Eucalyptus grandis TaxID=71139 RepID=A0ACC3K203_EUCGR|nr:hypothetical protein EUGRSUZ_G00707 [Eucalyptus grandis]
MKFFFEGPMEAPKLERVQVRLNARYEAIKYQYFWKGNLNMTIQNMFEEMATFAGSKFMRLLDFPKLIVKWHNEPNPITSSWQPKSLVVDKCPSFINAIPSSLMLVLDKLSFLQVRDCELLEEIFDLEGLEAMESTRVLPQLQELNLANLPKLRRLWNKDLQQSICFNSLGSLILYNCNNLGHAFAPSMARCLANLQNIKIKECGQMEGVIAEEEGQGSVVENITFLNLLRMELKCLPNLTCFLLGKNHKLECPKLQTLSIAYCPKMRTLIGQSWMENDHNALSLFTPQPPDLRPSSPIANGGVTGALIRLTPAMSKPRMAGFLCFKHGCRSRSPVASNDGLWTAIVPSVVARDWLVVVARPDLGWSRASRSCRSRSPVASNDGLWTAIVPSVVARDWLVVVARPDLGWSRASRSSIVHGRKPSSSMARQEAPPQIWRPQLVHGHES